MKDDLVYLGHIKEFCEDLIEYLYEIEDYDDFKKSKLYQDAIVRKLEIIGEAAKNVSSEVREKYPNIPWREMIGMRNIIIHQYFGINYNIVWEVLTRRIPILLKDIEKIIEELE